MSVISVAISLSLNVFSSCGIIFLNKHLFKNHYFTFGTTLTVCHFLVTFILCLIFSQIGVFQAKRLDMKKVLPLSVAFCGYVVFNNLSLMFNSVSFYQVMKILCTPLIILIQSYFYDIQTDSRTKLALLPVCFGIFITVVTDLEVNLYGTIFASLATISNTLYTIWGKTKMKELDANPMQILLYQSITACILLCFCIPVFDDTELLITYHYNVENVTWILSTCITAFLVNFSFFLLSSVTSSLTVNVIGYLKTCIVFIGGFVLFNTKLEAKNVFGISLTLLGVLIYTYVKMYPIQTIEPIDTNQDLEDIEVSSSEKIESIEEK
eukprot:gene3729-6617_t